MPTREGDWWYYSRTEEGKQYASHCRAPIAGPDDWTPPALDRPSVPGEQVLLDDNVEAEGHDFYALGSFDVSRRRHAGCSGPSTPRATSATRCT